MFNAPMLLSLNPGEEYIITSGSENINAKVYYKPKGYLGDWIAVTAGESIDANASFHIDVVASNLDAKDIQTGNYQVKYRVEEYLTHISSEGIINVLGEPRGKVTAEDGYVVLQFDKDWIDGIANNSSNKMTITAKFAYEGGLDLDKIANDDDGLIRLGDIDLQIPDASDAIAQFAEVNINKAPSDGLIPVENTDGSISYYLEYTVTVEAGQYGSEDVKLIDTLGGALKYVDKSVNSAGYIGVDAEKNRPTGSDAGTFPVESKPTGKDAGYVYLTSQTPEDLKQTAMKGQMPAASADGSNLAWYIGTMGPNEVRTLTYRIKVTDDYLGIPHEGEDITNTVNLFSKNYPRGTVGTNFHSNADLRLSKDFVNNPNVRYNEATGLWEADYKITVSAPNTNDYTMTNVKIKDIANDGSNYAHTVKLVPGTVKLYAADGSAMSVTDDNL